MLAVDAVDVIAPTALTAPLFDIENSVLVANAAVLEETANTRLLEEDALGVAATVSRAYGELVPTPSPVPVVAPVKKDRF